MKRVLNISFWIFIVVGTLVLLSFVGSEQAEMICENLSIEVDHSNGMYFIQREDVEEVLQRSGNNPLGKKLRNIDVGVIEKLLFDIPEVENSNVYRTIDGKIGINIIQRTPIVRVFNRFGGSFYIDNHGMQMPVSDKYFPRVPVVNGYIQEPMYDKSVFEIASDSILRNESLLDEIYSIAKIIHDDPFWNAQIQEVYFNRSKEIELVPMIGDHRIIVGDTSHLQQKLNKLIVFYDMGIENGGWNKYDTINLKFKNQIVCTKK